MLGGLGGLALGGLIGSMLFGGMGHGLGGGIGLLEILLMAGLAYLAFSFLRRRTPQPAAPAGYASMGGTPWQPEPVSRSTATVEAPPVPADVDRGLDHIRQMDSAFDPARFGETASDVFFKLQAAWMARDMTSVRPLLTDEMHALLAKDCERLRTEGRVNRLENVAVRSVDPTEAWQESGQDFITVCFRANLLDYTTDESGTRVLEGNRTEPVKFEEYWTFVRPVGPNPWRLSAIHQAS